MNDDRKHLTSREVEKLIAATSNRQPNLHPVIPLGVQPSVSEAHHNQPDTRSRLQLP
jgi:hypothetical protein